MGPANAPVTLVVFSDFQCPFCAVLMRRLQVLRGEYPKEVAIVYRHFPLADHEYAIAAARASECAADQGRFESFENTVFSARDSIGLVPWERFAATAGVPDVAAFRDCAASAGPLPALARDTVDARQLEVTGTPTLLINSTLLQGAQPLDTLRAYVTRAVHERAANDPQ